MKQYLLFAYDRHYPLGGWADFQEDFDTVEEAVEKWEEYKKGKIYENAQIVDITDGSVVERFHAKYSYI